MPFASAGLLLGAAAILTAEDADVVIARTAEGFEPLHAVYRRERCMAAIAEAIAADQWRMIAWFDAVRVRTLLAKEIQRYDPHGLAFRNVNTPAEFAEAEKYAIEQSAQGKPRG